MVRRVSQASSVVVVVLVASTVVAAVLASQAIAAARQRAAISEAMLRQYAQLATLEYARTVRRDVEEALVQTLNTYAHPERADTRHFSGAPCACLTPAAVERWFEVTPAGEVKIEPESLRTEIAASLARAPRPRVEAASEGMVTMFEMPGDPLRLVALKPEPHLRPSGGRIGLIAPVDALAPALERAFTDAPLLPDWISAGGDARDAVHLEVRGTTGATIFTSPNTVAGPFTIEAPLWPNQQLPLGVTVSMTPSFVAGLGPEHGTGSSVAVVSALVIANIALVGVGLWQLRRERELTRLRGDFVAGVSHELRTPLAQIRMFSEMLTLDRVRSEEERQRALRIIGQEAIRISHLVDNVLQFHRRGGAAAALPAETVDLSAFAAEVTASFEPLAASKRATVLFAPSTEPVPVRADLEALRQVLLNLLDNAVKFGPPGQTVRVSILGTAGECVINVDDEGLGVPADDRVRIFEAFARGTDTRGTGGAGIGLAIVRDIVHAHDGTVSAGDAPGGGGRFTVRLPLVVQEQ